MRVYYIITNVRTSAEKVICRGDYTKEECAKIMEFYLSHKDYEVRIIKEKDED